MASRFTFFQSYYESLKDLPAEAFKKLVCAMCEFVFNGEEPDFDGTEKSIFLLIKPTLKKSMEIIEKRAAAGRNGGISKPKQAEATESKPKQTEAKPSKPKFTPPTAEEVRRYCEERKNGVDPNGFVDFYTSKGWKVGNNPMKDWRAAVRTWEQRSKAKPQTNTKVHNHEERAYDFAELERRLIKN